ncbi:Fic/DOC family protein [Actinomycetospora sp. CA-084318]|uniref:Fic/DOC family protein n=1 Tax=Actinomycetospora sp. CA-084318 TaxID=3239892 RepID=UPI003D994701
MSRDPYVNPRSGVLRNRLDITDADELVEVEAEVTALRITQVLEHGLPGEYDLAHLQAFHARVFGDVYPWAGELRTVGIDKGVPFCPPEHLTSFAHDVFRRLAADGFLRGRDRTAFLDGLTDLVGNLNALHPFREGNGRTVRLFVAQLARDAGYDLRWRGMDPDENVAASRASLAGDGGPLRAMLDGLLHEA